MGGHASSCGPAGGPCALHRPGLCTSSWDSQCRLLPGCSSCAGALPLVSFDMLVLSDITVLGGMGRGAKTHHHVSAAVQA